MWDEHDRLEALRGYDILDEPETADFDDFVEIAASTCEAPMAAVNLIDEARQWFAAEIGLGVREMQLDASICASVILQPGVTVVPDLRLDDRFDCNPLVTGAGGLRFYAGAVLSTSDGLPVGTLCVLDGEPRPEGLNMLQKLTLAALGRQVMTQLELRRALKQRAQAIETADALVRRMRDVLAEKDLLVQEVHHRVKNSLATVQSLLQLQARAAGDTPVAVQLQEGAARVRAFGAMHEHLYRIGAVAEVDIADYLRSLITDQEAAFSAAFGDRRIRFEATSALWPSSEAPALGLIVVELVTNALKYGAGDVAVSLRQANGEAVLTVEDAGSPPNGFDLEKSKGLGMRIVNGMLGGHRLGRLEVGRDQGNTRFIAPMRVPGKHP